MLYSGINVVRSLRKEAEAVWNWWTGLLDWNTGLDYWTGILDWNTEMA